jgi:hypothetical protein
MTRFKLFCFVLLPLLSYAQERITISGYVKDGKNGESLIGATVYKMGTGLGATTNEYGFYSLTLPKGQHSIAVSLLGYKTYSVSADFATSAVYNFELEDESRQLEEVEVTGEAADRNVKSSEMSVARLDIKQINKIPALLGEVDVIRSIQLLPGVTTAGEGASGFNVRGGNIDQNLVLLDEAPVYNSSHLFGFFSVFNPDAVKDVKLIKGGIPAQYGGRVSSILDVRMKEGNAKRLAVSGGLGTIFTRVSVEGPLIKNRASFIIAGRRSYIDALVKPFLKETNALKKADFYFYDLTAKFNYRINDKNTIFASGYLGRDVFGVTVFNFNWGNATATTRWNHVFSRKLFMNLTAFYSNYDYYLAFDGTGGQSFKWNSNVVNYSGKADLSYYHNSRNTMRFGAQALMYDFLPYRADVKFENASLDIKSDKRYGVEYSAYYSNEQKLGPKFGMDYGLRLSYYTYVGKGKAFTFGDTLPNSALPLRETRTYGNGEVISAYPNLEPRFSLNYLLTKKSSVKASYNRMAQYIQLISNTAASTPLDVYTLASNNLKPLLADQGSVGYFRNFRENTYEASLEVYYKYLQNQLDYIDNADLFINPTVEGQLLQGLGRAYGTELYIKKTRGRLQGWISYTFSKTERLVRGISNDKWFLSRYDRTHVFNSSLTYEIGENWTVSGNFVFLSGLPATFPDARIAIQNLYVPYNTTNTRNNYRITPYHRLDLGLTFRIPHLETERDRHAIVLSVYNAYNRRNAYSIYFRNKTDGGTLQTEAVRFSIVGSIVPAITYNFSF